MRNFDPGELLLPGVPTGVRQANALAQRLEQTFRTMGDGISEGMYRRARDALVRGDQQLLMAESDSAAVIRELMRREPSSPPARRSPDIGLPEDPRALREAWEGLSPADRDRFHRMDPFIGNRDGIPHADRDRYNRRTLQHLREDADAAGDGRRVGELDQIARILHEPEPGLPSFYLSHIDREGRISYSLDNPDLADNTVVLLKPAGQDSGVGYAYSPMRQLRQAALLVDPNARTSVAYWGDYDQPRSMMQAIFPQFAHDGAAAARSFHDGLRVTHEGTSAHTTTIGHSYGGVLAGQSASHGTALATDNMIFFGSWGTGAHHADDLNLAGATSGDTGEHVFATMAYRDSVQLMPDTHGPLPTESDFGATVFDSDTARDPNDRWSWGEHSSYNYLRSSHPSFENIGRIITGNGGLVS